MIALWRIKEFVITELKDHRRTLAVFSMGVILYDALVRIFLIITNMLPLQSELFNLTLSSKLNNLFIVIDVCLIFLLLQIIFLPDVKKTKNRHWYE